MADRHSSNFVIHLPEQLRPVMQALSAKNDRPVSVELQRAIIYYATAEGFADICPEGAILRTTRAKPQAKGKTK